MKVLYFMNHVDSGGAALALYDLIKELKESCPDVKAIVITGCHNQLNEAFSKIGIENYSAPFKNFSGSYRQPKFLWKSILQIRYRISKPTAIKKIEKLIDFTTIDIIHSNLNRIDIGYYFAQKYRIKHLWHIREHGDDDFLLMPVFSSYNPILTDSSSTFIAISKSVKSKWLSLGIPEQNIRLIYDGIGTSHWTKNETIVKKSKLSFIFLGGYHVNKGQEIFIQALSLLPKNIKDDILVHFFGNGSIGYKKKLERLIQKKKLNKFCNLYDYNPDIYKTLSQYHIGVNCSKAEGFGRITVEYMMAGLCPLVSNTGANVEIIDNQINGLMFDRDNLFDIMDKIIFLYTNRDFITDFSKKATKKAISSFSMKAHAQLIYDLYKQNLN